jgi:hypothetical protein
MQKRKEKRRKKKKTQKSNRSFQRGEREDKKEKPRTPPLLGLSMVPAFCAGLGLFLVLCPSWSCLVSYWSWSCLGLPCPLSLVFDRYRIDRQTKIDKPIEIV